jgi:protein gp37
MAKRLAGNPGIAQDERRAYAGGPFHLNQKKLEAPLHWRKPARIGVQFMGDWMHLGVKYEWINAILDVIGNCPQHTFFTLTKRPERIVQQVLCAPEYYDPKQRDIPFPYFENLWLGVTVCNQAEAGQKIPELLRIPGFKRWVSVEPMLGPIDVRKGLPPSGPEKAWEMECGGQSSIDWVVAGAETGPGARHARPNWFKDLRDQAVAAGVPFFLKKLSYGGRTLDGVEWNELP